MERLQELLSMVYTDLLLLKTGTWQPDDDSCNACISNIEEIASEVDVELIDLREDVTDS